LVASFARPPNDRVGAAEVAGGRPVAESKRKQKGSLLRLSFFLLSFPFA
jgi:hypothetical protein